jgi:hypothetical protein
MLLLLQSADVTLANSWLLHGGGSAQRSAHMVESRPAGRFGPSAALIKLPAAFHQFRVPKPSTTHARPLAKFELAEECVRFSAGRER